MDVVKREFEAVRGQVGITSEMGKGRTHTLTSSLTLPTVDGQLAKIGHDQVVFSMSVVTHNVAQQSDRSRNNGRNILLICSELVPCVRFRPALRSTARNRTSKTALIANQGGDRVGMIVTRGSGNHHTVSQSLAKSHRNLELASGLTITGKDRVALILDLAVVVSMAGEHRHQEDTTISVQGLDRSISIIKQQQLPVRQGAFN